MTTNRGLINKDQLMVSIDKTNSKFSFYDVHRNLLGEFTIDQLIKCLSQETKFMEHINCDSASNDIIHTFICTVDIDSEKSIDSITINLKNNLESPFMSNIEMIMQLNNYLHVFEKNNLEQELLKLDSLNGSKKMKKKIRYIVKQFIYLLLNHTLRLIATISEQIKHDPDKKEQMASLLKYSSGITYKMSIFVKNHLDNTVNQINELNNNFNELKEIRKIMQDKLLSLEHKLSKQDEKIDGFLSTLNISKKEKHIDSEQTGGNKEDKKQINFSSSHTSSFVLSESDNNGFESEKESNTELSDYSAIYNLSK
jgi:hypothetical protein